MAPVRSKKAQTVASPAAGGHTQIIPTKTPHNRSPIKKRKMGISLAQKQAIIDNLQLEITERARRLRAQYNQQAQSLRSRIEIRVNRIPTSLRKMTMGELMQRWVDQQQRPAPSRAPPVPAKDRPRTSPHKLVHVPIYAPHMATRHGNGRLSHDELAGPDKENEGSIENPKKRHRGALAASKEPGQILSPTSSNSRLAPRGRPASPPKSQIARPATAAAPPPSAKAAPPPTTTRGNAANMLSSMVERAKATRAGVGRKTTATSTTSSSSAGTSTTASTTAAARTRRGAATTNAAATRHARRVSGVSNASNDSSSTVVKKTTTTARGGRATATTTAAVQKRTVMGTLKKGVTGGTGAKRGAAAKAPAPTTTTRVLRKRT